MEIVEIPSSIKRTKKISKRSVLKPVEVHKSGKEIPFSAEEFMKKLENKIGKINWGDGVKKEISFSFKIPEVKTKFPTPLFSVSNKIPQGYILMIKERIKENWKLKDILSNCSAIVSFYLYPDGRMENIIIEKSSGVSEFDKSVIDAIKKTGKVEPFPPEIKAKYLNITIQFITGSKS